MNKLLKDFIWTNRYRLKFGCEVSNAHLPDVRRFLSESGLESTPEQLIALNKLILQTIEEMEKEHAV